MIIEAEEEERLIRKAESELEEPPPERTWAFMASDGVGIGVINIEAIHRLFIENELIRITRAK